MREYSQGFFARKCAREVRGEAKRAGLLLEARALRSIADDDEIHPSYVFGT
jgi:hypothetical protein